MAINYWDSFIGHIIVVVQGGFGADENYLPYLPYISYPLGGPIIFNI